MNENRNSNPDIVAAELPFELSMNKIMLWWLLNSLKRRKVRASRNREKLPTYTLGLRVRRPPHSAGWKRLAEAEVNQEPEPDRLMKDLRAIFGKKGLDVISLKVLGPCEGFDAGGPFSYYFVKVILT